MKKASDFVGKYMAIIVLAVAALALFVPKSCLWIQTSWINYLLMIVMFGMGLTLEIKDFAIVFKRPKDIIIGCIAQFTVMPLLAFILGKIFGLEAGLLAGVILVGTCPGGTASNVMTYLSKGDVALSVGMTSVNTLLSPFLTPEITYLLLKTTVNVDIVSMFLSIIKVVIVPIALGFILGLFLKLSMPKKKALAIEIGMQNSGLATSLAGSSFPDLTMATVPGAIFSVWHNISGALLANVLRRIDSEVEAR